MIEQDPRMLVLSLPWLGSSEDRWPGPLAMEDQGWLLKALRRPPKPRAPQTVRTKHKQVPRDASSVACWVQPGAGPSRSRL